MESKKLAMLVDESPVLSDGRLPWPLVRMCCQPWFYLLRHLLIFRNQCPFECPRSCRKAVPKMTYDRSPEAGQLPAVGIVDMSVVAQRMMPAMATAGAAGTSAGAVCLPEFAASLGDVMSGQYATA